MINLILFFLIYFIFILFTVISLVLLIVKLLELFCLSSKSYLVWRKIIIFLKGCFCFSSHYSLKGYLENIFRFLLLFICLLLIFVLIIRFDNVLDRLFIFSICSDLSILLHFSFYHFLWMIFNKFSCLLSLFKFLLFLQNNIFFQLLNIFLSIIFIYFISQF